MAPISQSKGKVLVLGDDLRSFLSVIRSLGRRGLRVEVGWCAPDCPARFSRYVSRFHVLPPYSAKDSGWKLAFKRLLQSEDFDLVIPCDDPRIIPLQFNRAELEPLARIYLLEDRAFQITSNKLASQQLAKELGVPVPRSVQLSRVDGDRLEGFGLPLVLKPLSSFTHENILDRNRVRKAYSYEDAVAALDRMLIAGPVLVEENFLGRGVGVEVLANEGKILTAFQHQRVHEPLLGGGSSYRRVVPLHPELLEATRRLMRALDYTGVAMVEFKLDPATGRFVLIEINGRFWGSLPLALSAGADFPWFLYQMLVLGKREFPQRFKTNLYCRNWIADIDWFRSNLRADRTDPTLATLPLTKVLGEAWHLLTFKERSDTLVLDDPKPAWVEVRQWIRAKWIRLRCALSLRLLSIPPLRAWARRSARSALRTSHTVLFVCQGNICRSPFAEAFAGTMLNTGTTLRSFGFDPREGRSSPPEAQRAAAELGIDLSRHRSRLLTEEALQGAGAVFLFDAANYYRFATAFPAFRRKAHLLGLLDDAKAVTIADPWGSDPEAFLQTYRRIQDALAKAVSPASSDARSSRARAPAASGA